ncbi:MAG TPA: hypothetical protein VNX68_11490, partial [Nitrosopumilaceae archaeon]|nr:hypothetical protein [Nitrosopumilaceae archaeon]
KKIQETAWGEVSNQGNTKKKLTGFDILAAFAKKLKSWGNKKIDAKVEYNEDQDISEYTLSLGKLSISRTRRSN